MAGENGNGHHARTLQFTHPPKRVVSLVPSLTESMFELGLGSAVVGITDYCVHPAAALAGLPRLGGTKNPRLEEIVALKPELVMANMEENHRQTVEALEEQGLAVWVTFPRSVQGALDVLWTLTGLFHSQHAPILLPPLQLPLDGARAAGAARQPLRCFCPIWHERTASGQPWWMTFNHETYCSDLLAVVGAQNVFAERQRRYPLDADLGKAEAQEPGERDRRYPRVTLDEIIAAQPEVILLPNEPFAFAESHLEELRTLLRDTPAVRQGRIIPVDGSLITWHGTRLARALRELPALLDFHS